VLAVRLDDASGALAQAQAALSEALAAGGWYAPEKRPFLAHVTVARGAGARVSEVARRGGRGLRPPPSLAFEGSRITLFRSRLSAAGARYEPLGEVLLS
jgi:2'-5' RNA ligase